MLSRSLALIALAALGLAAPPVTAASPAPAPMAVLDTYADIAAAAYGDALAGARTLKAATDRLIAEPSPAALDAAREAWIAARIPYMQTEAYRFGNPIVDEWETKVNAWPLDEGLIDYVGPDYGLSAEENPAYAANVIANAVLTVGTEVIDAREITPALLTGQLHELGGVEANVATGWHAIEFLLWGQDLNGTGPGAGSRPWSDYARGSDCTAKGCERRGQYLAAATQLLIDDLAWMVDQWAEGGAARAALTAESPQAGLAMMLTGLGSLSYGELAGERMKLGLMLHDPEEEHDCFSDMTHLSHYYDQIGMMNVYLGRYRRPDGQEIAGPGLTDLVAARDDALDRRIRQRLDAAEAALAGLVRRAEAGEAYDQLIAADNPDGNALVQRAIDALVAQARGFEEAVAALGLAPIAIEGSDSLDDPEAVFE